MHPDDQAAIHAYLLAAVKRGDDLRAMLPKPVTAADLLALARP